MCSSGGALGGRLVRSRCTARVCRTELGFFLAGFDVALVVRVVAEPQQNPILPPLAIQVGRFDKAGKSLTCDQWIKSAILSQGNGGVRPPDAEDPSQDAGWSRGGLTPPVPSISLVPCQARKTRESSESTR